jgi:hypothetical protein
MTSRIEELLAHCEAMDAIRRPWESLWEELARVVHPRRGMIANNRSANQLQTPESQADDAFDGTAMRALRTLATGVSARVTPQGARWFGMKPDDGVKASSAGLSFYHRASDTVAQQIRKSNFHTAATEHYLDRGAFGTALTMVREGKNGKGLHFEAVPVGTFSIEEDENGEVDTVAITLWRTPKQLKQMYGTVPESVEKKFADPKMRTVPLEVKWLIRPRIDRDPRKVDATNKAWESIHILPQDKAILREEGFDEFPCACSRWERWGNTPYGWPPSYMALPEAVQANFLEQMMDTLAETAAFPRVLYPSNIKGDVNFRALGLTCYDPQNGQKPEEWLTQGRYDIGKDRLEDKRRAIEDAFYVPLFNGISQLGSDTTAEQVRALVSESRELFHPILAGLTREFLSPIIRRSFSINLRQGLIERPPDELLVKGELGLYLEDPGVEFTSPMALALEQSQLANFADVMNVLMIGAQADPSVLDFVNWQEIGPAFFRYKGLPESFIHTPEAVAAIQEARAMQAQAAMAKEAAGAVNQLGGARGISELSALDPGEEAA